MTDVEKRVNRLTDEEWEILHHSIKNGTFDRLVRMAEKDKNMEWLGATIRNASVYVVGVLGAIALTYDWLIGTVKHLVGK